MKTGNQIYLKIALSMAFLVLGGCLSDKGDSEFAGSPTDPGISGNAAPSISGNPPGAIKVGEFYSFTPNASDPDGDSLTFSIENQPSWANFDNRSGQISGTPTLANIGMFSNVRISVSDGNASASLPTYAIDVTQFGTASTTLTWIAPTMNEDGTTLTNLAGYKIYYGKSSGNYTNTIQIDNASVTTYLVDNLSQDTYYFAATAFNATGEESQYSGEAVRALN